MIEFTDKAIEEVRKIQSEEKDAQGHHLRIMVVAGGSGSMNYKMGFDPRPAEETDKTFEKSGVRFIVDARSSLFLNGVQVDFTEGVAGRGFVFNNPNARSKSDA